MAYESFATSVPSVAEKRKIITPSKKMNIMILFMIHLFTHM